MTRSSMLDVLQEDYIRTAAAKGLTEKVVLFRHALKNAFLPVITIIGLQAGIMLSGAVLTETIFSWPGIGLALLAASQVEDIPLAMGVLTILGVMTLVSHLVADIGYAFLDPRIRYS